MSKLNKKKVWMVRDPGPDSELGDIFFGTTFEELPKYIIGTGAQQWYREHHTWYDNEREAKADAEKRLAKMPKKAAYSYDRTASREYFDDRSEGVGGDLYRWVSKWARRQPGWLSVVDYTVTGYKGAFEIDIIFGSSAFEDDGDDSLPRDFIRDVLKAFKRDNPQFRRAKIQLHPSDPWGVEIKAK